MVFKSRGTTKQTGTFCRYRCHKKNQPNNRVLLEFNCLVVLFLLLYVICASVPAAGTERKGNIFFPRPTWIFPSYRPSMMMVLSTLSDLPDWSALEIMYSALNTENVERSLAKIKACATGYSLHVRESSNVLDSRFHAVNTGFQVLDSNLCKWNLDSGPSCWKADKR